MIDRKQFCQILDALGCSCSPPVPGTDTGWSLNRHCLMHRDQAKSTVVSDDQRREAARVLRSRADDIGMNDPQAADVLNRQANQTWRADD
jgi:hypothetical protein